MRVQKRSKKGASASTTTAANEFAFIQFTEDVKFRRISLRVYFLGTALKVEKEPERKIFRPCLGTDRLLRPGGGGGFRKVWCIKTVPP